MNKKLFLIMYMMTGALFLNASDEHGPVESNYQKIVSVFKENQEKSDSEVLSLLIEHTDKKTVSDLIKLLRNNRYELLNEVFYLKIRKYVDYKNSVNVWLKHALYMFGSLAFGIYYCFPWTDRFIQDGQLVSGHMSSFKDFYNYRETIDIPHATSQVDFYNNIVDYSKKNHIVSHKIVNELNNEAPGFGDAIRQLNDAWINSPNNLTHQNKYNQWLLILNTLKQDHKNQSRYVAFPVVAACACLISIVCVSRYKSTEINQDIMQKNNEIKTINVILRLCSKELAS